MLPMGTARFGKEQEGKEERVDALGHGQPETLSTQAQLCRGAEEGLKVCTRCQQGQDGAKKSETVSAAGDRECKSLDVG